MPNQEPESTQKSEVRSRPPHHRIFYANAVNYSVNPDQEAILDFMLVGPEDLNMELQATVKEDEEETLEKKSISLKTLPIEVRVYMPINQFMIMCKRMARLWQKLNTLQEGQPQPEDIEQMGAKTE